MLNNTTEIWKGLSDVPQGIIALIFSILILKAHTSNKKNRAAWFTLFLLVGIASFTGAAVHTFDITTEITKFVWTALYVILYTAVTLFMFCIVGYTTDRSHPSAKEKTITSVTGLVCFSASVFTLYKEIDLDIFIFVGFCALLTVPVVISSVKAGSKAKLIFIASGILALAMICQALRPIFAYGVVAAHILITVGMFFIYLTAVKDCSDAK